MKTARFMHSLVALTGAGLLLLTWPGIAAAAPDDPESVARELLRDPPRTRPIDPRDTSAFAGERVLPPIPRAPETRALEEGMAPETPIVVVERISFEGKHGPP